MTFTARLFTGLIGLLISGSIMAIEEPRYTVTEKHNAIELRIYASKIIAETTLTGSMKATSKIGFKRLAGYIFGDNQGATGETKKISMTAPVTMQPRSQKISMTAPVTMTQNQGQWRMHFVMPAKYTMATLPKPNNPAVKLRQVPAEKYAVLRFSGTTSEARVAKQTETLLQWMKKKGLKPKRAPELARYNPPWTLPFMRRNELMVHY